MQCSKAVCGWQKAGGSCIFYATARFSPAHEWLVVLQIAPGLRTQQTRLRGIGARQYVCRLAQGTRSAPAKPGNQQRRVCRKERASRYSMAAGVQEAWGAELDCKRRKKIAAGALQQPKRLVVSLAKYHAFKPLTPSQMATSRIPTPYTNSHSADDTSEICRARPPDGALRTAAQRAGRAPARPTRANAVLLNQTPNSKH